MTNALCMEKYEDYLKNVKKASDNTLSSYLRDIRQMGEYLSSHSDDSFDSVTAEELEEYTDWMKAKGKSVPTIARSIASIKNFYKYLIFSVHT